MYLRSPRGTNADGPVPELWNPPCGMQAKQGTSRTGWNMEGFLEGETCIVQMKGRHTQGSQWK